MTIRGEPLNAAGSYDGAEFDIPRLLECPLCGFDHTHLEVVDVATRPDGEDGRIATVAVGVHGRLELDADVPIESGYVGVGRRDRAALRFRCEGCDEHFALVFTQHKGQTMIDAVRVADPHHMHSTTATATPPEVCG